MAKLSTFSPQTHFILKNQILGIQQKPLFTSSSSSKWTRNFSPILDTFPKISNCKNTSIKLRNVLYVGRLTSLSTTSLLAIPNSSHYLCSSCPFICLPSSSLYSLCRSHSSSLRFLVMSSHSNNPTSQDSIKTVRCVIKGRVQGVFYRNWTVDNATQLGLKGWVRNRRDRSVEALFSGKAEVVDQMVERCRRGPPDAMVTALQVNPSDEDPGVSFDRKPTA